MARFGIATLDRSPLLGFDADLVGWTHAAANAGFDAIGYDVFALRLDDLDAVTAAVAETGLEVSDLAGLNIGPDDGVFASALNELDIWCAHLRPEWVLVKVDVEPDDRVVELLRRAHEVFDAHRVRLGIEPSATSPVATIAATTALLDRAGIADAGVIVDSWHFFANPEWVELESLGDRLAYVQLSDGLEPVGDDRVHETLHRRALPGLGRLDLDRFVDTVSTSGFDGLVTAEVLSESERRTPLDDHVRRTHQALIGVWNRSGPDISATVQ